MSYSLVRSPAWADLALLKEHLPMTILLISVRVNKAVAV